MKPTFAALLVVGVAVLAFALGYGAATMRSPVPPSVSASRTEPTPLPVATAPTNGTRAKEVNVTWHVGGSLRWGSRNITFDNQTQWASDGSAYLYATSEAGGRDPATLEACRTNYPPTAIEGFVVLVSAPGCQWVEFPSTACDGTAACDAINGGHLLQPPQPN